MADLPDSFDLWVRRARTASPTRQTEILLGTLLGQLRWYFINQNKEHPTPAAVTLDGQFLLLLFTSPDRAGNFIEASQHRNHHDPVSMIDLSPEQAVPWCLNFAPQGVSGLLVNPGDYAFTIDFPGLNLFYQQWQNSGSRSGQGFWIPNMTSEEEDFWQEHGV
jgi:hypothetical protein